MAEFDLNLSTQAFPAYRITTTALVCVLVVFAVISIWQAEGFVRYSNMSRAIRSQEQENRVEAEGLAKRVAELESRLDRPESTAKLNEIGFLNHMILRKNLSWTKLFAVLEELVPENVHFVNLTPDVGTNGAVMLKLGVRARSMADMKNFLQRVEKSPLFEKVLVTVEEKNQERKDGTGGSATTDVDVTLSTVYYPQRDSQ